MISHVLAKWCCTHLFFKTLLNKCSRYISKPLLGKIQCTSVNLLPVINFGRFVFFVNVCFSPIKKRNLGRKRYIEEKQNFTEKKNQSKAEFRCFQSWSTFTQNFLTNGKALLKKAKLFWVKMDKITSKI